MFTMKLKRRYPKILIISSILVVLVLSAAGPAIANRLEDLERRYYMSEEEKRTVMLDNIRELGTDDALEFTVNLLRYPDIRVRMEAASSIQKWGVGGYEAAFAGLGDSEISWMCESIFANLGAAVTPFLTAKLDHKLASYRARAAYILGVTADANASESLVGLLRDPSREVRIQAIQALAGIKKEETLPRLLELFEEDDVELSEYVLLAVERFGFRAVTMLEITLKSRNEKLRAGAAMGLGRIRIPDTIPMLKGALDDPSPMVRSSAVRSLGEFRDMRATAALLEALDDPDRSVQDYTSSALSRLAPDIVPVLIKELGSDNPLVRKNSISALRKTGDKRALWPIMQALDDVDRTVRMFAVTALMQFKDPIAIKPMIERLKKEKEIQWLVSFAFMELGSQAADELLSAMGDEEFCYTRNLIVLRMGERALDVLHKNANSGDVAGRMNAIALLGEMGNPASLETLGGLLGDEEVGWVAAHALAQMGEPAWGTLIEHSQKTGLIRANALAGISLIEDPKLLPKLVECLSGDDKQLRLAVTEPLIRAGADSTLVILENLSRMPAAGFETAVDVLCRIDDPKAGVYMRPVLFPGPGIEPAIGKRRSYLLRQAYARKGGLDYMKKRLRNEMGGVAGGGVWQRVAH